MPYITINANYTPHQLTWEEVMEGKCRLDDIYAVKGKNNTRTRIFKEVPKKFSDQFNMMHLRGLLGNWIAKYEHLYEKHAICDRQMLRYKAIEARKKELEKKLQTVSKEERTNTYEEYQEVSKELDQLKEEINSDGFYRVYYIPKHSGGYRRIDQPCDELNAALTELREIFENDFKILHHTTAYAYIKRRCNKDMVVKHQQNESYWFYKTDLTDFFGSTTLDFTLRMMKMIYPLSGFISGSPYWMADSNMDILTKALQLCFLGGGLPQGTTISPFLSNLVMLPIDHYISNHLRPLKNGDKEIIGVYTRYADDIVISSKHTMDEKFMTDFVNSALRHFDAPYEIKESKTKYGSRDGRNWILGIMLNKDNEISIGYKAKQVFRAQVYNYLRDRQENKLWTLGDLQALDGLRSYYNTIEPSFISESIDKKYGQKFGVDLVKTIRTDIRNICVGV